MLPAGSVRLQTRAWQFDPDSASQRQFPFLPPTAAYIFFGSHFSQAIDEWKKRLLAYVRMKGHHFEHLMYNERKLNLDNVCCKNTNVLKFTV